jgi:hypothetical protein
MTMICRFDHRAVLPNLPNLRFEVGRIQALIFKRFPNLPNLPSLFFARAPTRTREIKKRWEGWEGWEEAGRTRLPGSQPKNGGWEGWEGFQVATEGGCVMREKMPLCAAFVDDLREFFGAGEMNHVLRTGLKPDCEPRLRVHFVEAGHELGRAAGVLGVEAGHELGRAAGVLGVEVSPTVLPPVSVPAPKRGRK